MSGRGRKRSADGDDEPNQKVKRPSQQKYKEDYSRTWPELVRSGRGTGYVRCTLCCCDVNINHGGRDDCRRHVISEKHKDYKKQQTEHSSITSLFGKSKAQQDATASMNTIRAECLFVDFLVEHNLPIATADHANKIFPQMFPDSKIAKEFACARTKSKCIVDTLAENTVEQNVVRMKEAPYSLATDGSSEGDKKYFPIVARVIDNNGMIKTVLMGNPTCKGGATGENIFKLLDKFVKEEELDWGMCLAFGGDNANVMSGRKRGVMGFMEKEHKDMYFVGCPCHLIHLAARHAGDVLPVKVDELLVDIYYYLDKSTNRKEALHQCQQVYGTEHRKIIKYVSTRWLCLASCLERLVQQWLPLRKFFVDECQNDKNSSSR